MNNFLECINLDEFITHNGITIKCNFKLYFEYEFDDNDNIKYIELKHFTPAFDDLNIRNIVYDYVARESFDFKRIISIRHLFRKNNLGDGEWS